MRHSGSNWLWPVFHRAASLRSPGRLGQPNPTALRDRAFDFISGGAVILWGR
jgi:hypothetical protein